MPISEAQLEVWSHQGSVTQSASTYATVKLALEATGTGYENKGHEVFLQGSYGNSTNVWSESDVDVVIKCDATYYSDLTKLSTDDRKAYDAAFIPASYSYAQFKSDVLDALTNRFGADAKAGDKAITIAGNGARRKADVIAAMDYRRYWKFKGTYDQNYDEGICFINSSGKLIANYPKQHSANLTSRHQASGYWLKPMVRVLKNLRTKLVEDGSLAEGVAPSYFLEGLLYNVPSDKFGRTYEDCFVNAINWINGSDQNGFVCANEQHYLLRTGFPTCWPVNDGEAFLSAALKAWNDW